MHHYPSSILRYSIIFFVFIAFFIAGCKKDDKGQKRGNDMLTVEFSAATLPLEQVDSINVYFLGNGGGALKSLTKKDNIYQTSLNDVKRGAWKMLVWVYVKIPNDTRQRRYDLEQAITLNEQGQSFEYNGPNGDIEGDWKTRVIYQENNRSIEVIVGLNPEDPYIGMGVIDKKIGNVFMKKTAVYKNADGTEASDSAKWQCTQSCFSFYNNIDYDSEMFVAFSQRMTGRNWLRSEISSRFVDTTTGQENTFHYLYTK